MTNFILYTLLRVTNETFIFFSTFKFHSSNSDLLKEEEIRFLGFKNLPCHDSGCAIL